MDFLFCWLFLHTSKISQGNTSQLHKPARARARLRLPNSTVALKQIGFRSEFENRHAKSNLSKSMAAIFLMVWRYLRSPSTVFLLQHNTTYPGPRIGVALGIPPNKSVIFLGSSHSAIILTRTQHFWIFHLLSFLDLCCLSVFQFVCSFPLSCSAVFCSPGITIWARCGHGVWEPRMIGGPAMAGSLHLGSEGAGNESAVV